MKKIYFPLLIFFIYLFLVFNKFHSSSIGVYHQFFYGSKKDPNLIFGQPRPIRSDEWLVATPKIVGQVIAGFPVINKNIGFGEVMPVQGCLPYKHWRVIFCPNMWPFFFLPLEKAFSASWWFLTFVMNLAIYFFILQLTGSIFTAIFSSLIFFFTPFNQWWTYPLSSIVGYGLLFITFFLKTIESKGWRKVLYFLLSSYFLTCYAFILYPPFQIASFYVFGLLLLGILIEKKLFNKKNIALGLALVIFSVLPIIVFYQEFRPTIEIIRNTVYPGKRFVSNSIGDFLHLINGFYNIQLLDDIKGSGPFGNQSEASNFFLVSFFSLPVYLWILINQTKRKKIDWIFLSLISSFIFLLIWFLFPFPSLLAKLSLLSLVPQKRALIGIGIANYLLAIYFLVKVKINKDSFYIYLKWFSVSIIFLTNLYLGFFFKYNYPVFIQNNIKIFLISFFSSLLVYQLLSQQKSKFLILFLIFSIVTSYRVNPFYRELSPLLNTDLAKFIQKQTKKENNQYYWVNFGSIVFEDYFLANGAKSLSGVYYYPQYNLIKIFDPKGDYREIWNRYAHVNFFEIKTKETQFFLNQTDQYSIGVNLCSLNFKKNRIKYLFFDYPQKNKCLNIFNKTNNFFIYEIKENDT